MAALSCPGDMAEEYVQVVVGGECAPGQVVVLQGGGPELSADILHSLSHSDTVYYVQPDGSLLPGGSLREAAGGRLLLQDGEANGGRPLLQVEEEAGGTPLLEEGQAEGRPLLEAGGTPPLLQEEAIDRLLQEEALQPGLRLEAVNLVSRGPVVEVAHPEVILLPEEPGYPGVSLVSGGQLLEAVQADPHLNGGQVEEAVPPAVSQEHGGLLEGAAHPAVTAALNLTKEAAPHQEAATMEAGLAAGGAPEMAVPNQSLPAVGGAANSPLPTLTPPVLKDAAQQLKTVAHQVAVREGDAVTRILSHKQLKSIRVQLPGIQSKKSADPVVLNLSTVHMKTASPSLLGAQVVQIKSVSDSAQPLVVNSSPLDSPFQIFVRQTQLSAGKSRLPDLKNAGKSLEHQSCVAHSQNGTRAPCMADQSQKKGHKRKKSVKIKTRSGRISRPPKHKAKDYKFLKVGDLIQDSTSDSEDYSELSTDEEDKGAKENSLCDLPPYVVKNTLFQCQTCEKSYMGKGGLSRHYRLYPSHGQMEPPLLPENKKNGESGVGGHSVSSEPKKPTPKPRKRLLADPLNPDDSSLPTLVTDSLEFVSVSTTCRGRRQMTGRRFGRPRKILSIASSEQNALAAKELIQQCEDADLKEHVAPCFSERLSVHDFLLVKVKQEHPDKPLFPHLYKELEKLHSMVRILAEEYFSNGGVGRTLEVADCKVAASLGISTEKIVKVVPSVTSSATEQSVQSVEENESLVEEMMPPPKRLKLEEPESVGSTEDVARGNATDIHEAEQRADLVPMDDESFCVTDTHSDATINCTEQITETSHPNTMDEEAANLHASTDPESLPCDLAQNLLETSPPLLSACFPESLDSSKISSGHPEKTLSDAIRTPFIRDTQVEEVLPRSPTDQLPQPSAADPALSMNVSPTNIIEKTCSESFQGVDAFITQDVIANDLATSDG